MENVDMNKSPIIVTGGAGFIGSHLVSRLIELGERVIVIDRYVDPNSYFARAGLASQVTLESIDIADRTAVYETLGKYARGFVFHLAAETIVTDCYKRPWDAMQTNIIGTVNLLESVRTMPDLEGIIVASSDKAYGKTKTAYTETSPLAGDHPYDVSKSCADLITGAYVQTYAIPAVITRFGNVYGEGDLHFDRIIPGIMMALASGEELVIRSDGTYVRDYLYVSDVVEGYVTLWRQFEKARGQAYNFSSPDTLSVLEVINLASKILQKPVRYRIANTAKNEIPYQHLNDDKIKKLGWKNNYGMKDVLKKIETWYSTHHEVHRMRKSES